MHNWYLDSRKGIYSNAREWCDVWRRNHLQFLCMNTWVFSLILNRKVCYMYKTCIYEFSSTYNDAFHVLINCKTWILSNEHPSFFNFVWICSYLMCLWTWKYTWWKICKLLVNFKLDNTINNGINQISFKVVISNL